MRKAFILSECAPPDCDGKIYALLTANPTKGHHYTAQTEQRQHAFNLQTSPQNRNVYAWPLPRFQHPPRGEVYSANIENNLVAHNLYTLSFVGDENSPQYNLENWFNRHETGYEAACDTLRQLPPGQHPAGTALERVLRLKLLSTLRNPHNHRDRWVRHLFSSLKQHLPRTSPAFRELIAARPQQRLDNITQQFHFNFAGYAGWLADLYGMLSEGVYRPSLFERLLPALLGDPAHSRLILHRYTEPERYCFLPDSNYCLQADTRQLSIGFSLAADMFLIVQISQLHWQSLSSYLGDHSQTPQINIEVSHNQHQQRKTFNRLCIRQAHHAVYGKSNRLEAFL